MLRYIRKFNLTRNPRADILSGLTVAIALVPEAIAFAFVAGVSPLTGLYAAAIIGFITALIGGRPGMISGATGALAVVLTSLVAQYGVEYLFATVILMGIFQLLAGILRLGKFIRLVPHPVMLGFVNGLAIVIGLAQLDRFKVDNIWMTGMPLYTMVILIGATMLIIFGLPKVLPRFSKIIPAPLIAIGVISTIVIAFGIDTQTVGDLASVKGALPSFHIPSIPLNLAALKVIVPYALILAAIGLIESLLTLNLIDEITETRGRTSQECMGQGVGNIVTGFFGGMGGCAMIGQSMININSGGRGRLSGLMAALCLMAFILVGSRVIDAIPIAALVGLMFVVVIKTFAWASLRLFGKIPKEDLFVIILVTGITVATDLAIAVISGVIVSALVFSWKAAHQIQAQTYLTKNDTKVYTLTGALFFGSTHSFRDLFSPKDDPDDVVIDFKNARVWDHSALEAIDALASNYQKYKKRLHLIHLSSDCQLLLHKAGPLVEVDSIEDPKYQVVVNYDNRIENSS